jgi:putative RNA 2'-phosphotransferase
VSLDPAGYTDLEGLAAALATQPGWESLSPGDIVALAHTDPRRYEVQDGRIRARYGHTVNVAEPGEHALPPEWLYLGVDAAHAAEVRVTGLRPSHRQHVHLATTPQAAREVGRRHTPDIVVVVVFARRAADAGITFRRAGTALFLTTGVPAEFLLLPS